MREVLLSALCLVAACGDSKSSDNAKLGVSVTQAAVGDCPNGGVDIHQGIDKNGNGQIDTSEVTSTETVCNGEDGDSCAVVDNGDGTKTITCGQGTSATVTDGIVVVATLACSGQLGATGTWVGHTAQITSKGDILYQCYFYEATGDGSKSGFYHHSQAGALDATCIVSYFGYDFLKFKYTYTPSTASLTDTVEYFDVSVSGTVPATTWALDVGACVVNQY